MHDLQSEVQHDIARSIHDQLGDFPFFEVAFALNLEPPASALRPCICADLIEVLFPPSPAHHSKAFCLSPPPPPLGEQFEIFGAPKQSPFTCARRHSRPRHRSKRPPLPHATPWQVRGGAPGAGELLRRSAALVLARMAAASPAARPPLTHPSSVRVRRHRVTTARAADAPPHCTAAKRRLRCARAAGVRRAQPSRSAA